MKKSDLKTGMIVESRTGDIGLVMLGTVNGNIIAGCGGKDINGESSMWRCFDGINEDLTSVYSRASDIVAVYTGGGSNFEMGQLKRDSHPLWRRPVDPIEMTISEVAEKLGIDPLLLKIVEKK